MHECYVFNFSDKHWNSFIKNCKLWTKQPAYLCTVGDLKHRKEINSMWNGRRIDTGLSEVARRRLRYYAENNKDTESDEIQSTKVVNYLRHPGEDLSSQIFKLLAKRQLNKVNGSMLKYKAELQSVVAKIDCCKKTECTGNAIREKVTVFPRRIDAITQVEISKDGKYIFIATKKNNLFAIDVKELEKTQGVEIPSEIEETVRECFKVVEKEENENIIQNLSNVFGPKTKRTFVPARSGINVIELSENEAKILTCGSTSNVMQVLDVDRSRVKGDYREPKGSDEELKKLYNRNLDYDPLEVYTKMGAMKVTAAAYTCGTITGGAWINNEVVAITTNSGSLNVYRLNDKRVNATKESSPWYSEDYSFNPTLNKLVVTAEGLRFPWHSLPVSGATQYPSLSSMSELVDITRIDHRGEVLVAGDEGEVHILKTLGDQGITTRGARREGIPRENLFVTEQRRNKIVTCQTVDQEHGTAIVGSLFGISLCDSRSPHLMQHIKMDIKSMRLTLRRRELDFGMPTSLTAANNVVTVGLCDGHIIHCDVRVGKWIMDGNSKLCWYMGVKERHEYENTYFPTLFPLRAIRKKHGIMAAAGGPLFGQAANEFDLNGVIALWK